MNDAPKDAGQGYPEAGRSIMPASGNSIGAVGSSYGSVDLGLSENEGNDLAVTLRQYLHIVIKHRWIILSCILAAMALGAVKALITTPLYSSTVRIQIDREPTKLLEQGSAAPQEEGGQDFLKTQFELLKSLGMAERVASQLRLNEDKEFLMGGASLSDLISGLLSRSSKQNTPSPADLQEKAIAIISSNVDIKPVPGSRLVDVTYFDPYPAAAQRIAKAYAEAYVASTVDKRFQANAYAKTFLEDQIKQLKLRLEESEKASLEFAEKEKIVEVNDKASIAENNLAAANSALGQLISERIKNEQLWRQIESTSGINLPQFLTNKVIEDLRSKRKELETEYQENLGSFKPGYPVMMQIANKIKETDKQIATEVDAVRKSHKAAFEAALGQEDEMKQRVEKLREEVLDLQKKSIQYNILKREVETNQGLYNNLLQRYKEVDIAGGSAASNVFIVDRAGYPKYPAIPNIPRTLMVSFIVGLVLGIGASYLIEMLDDRIRAPEEIEQVSGLATLGIIPRAASDDETGEALDDPRSSMSEAYRSFATALQFATESGLPRSISITSAGPGEGKSTTVLAVARHFAQMGLRVLLIDGDLRRPSLHVKQRLDNSVGLSNLLTGASLPPEVIQKTDLPNLAFIASGPLPPNAADLLSGTRIFSLISLGSEVFDLIIFDSPPLLGLADAQLIGSATAATVFVVGAGEQRKGVIRSALRRLQLGRVKVAGAVLTKFHAKTVGYTYAYSYKYGYSYGDEPYSYSKSPVVASKGHRKLPGRA
jgi:capsular exopolysaccharide synthesis family protein